MYSTMSFLQDRRHSLKDFQQIRSLGIKWRMQNQSIPGLQLTFQTPAFCLPKFHHQFTSIRKNFRRSMFLQQLMPVLFITCFNSVLPEFFLIFALAYPALDPKHFKHSTATHWHLISLFIKTMICFGMTCMKDFYAYVHVVQLLIQPQPRHAKNILG